MQSVRSFLRVSIPGFGIPLVISATTIGYVQMGVAAETTATETAKTDADSNTFQLAQITPSSTLDQVRQYNRGKKSIIPLP